MLERYTTHQPTNKRSLAFFLNIIDTDSLAAHILYYENNKIIQKKNNQNQIFLHQLKKEL